MPDADVTYMVGTGIRSGDNPFYTVIQRHSLSTADIFTPTEPTNPYENGYGMQHTTPAALPARTQGLKATYFSSTDLSGDAAFTRLGEYGHCQHKHKCLPSAWHTNLLPCSHVLHVRLVQTWLSTSIGSLSAQG
jgi:hypothetical protein